MDPEDFATVATVFPAHAGMSLRPASSLDLLSGFPRSRGDEPLIQSTGANVGKFSPLTRG